MSLLALTTHGLDTPPHICQLSVVLGKCEILPKLSPVQQELSLQRFGCLKPRFSSRSNRIFSIAGTWRFRLERIPWLILLIWQSPKPRGRGPETNNFGEESS